MESQHAGLCVKAVERTLKSCASLWPFALKSTPSLLTERSDKHYRHLNVVGSQALGRLAGHPEVHRMFLQALPPGNPKPGPLSCLKPPNLANARKSPTPSSSQPCAQIANLQTLKPQPKTPTQKEPQACWPAAAFAAMKSAWGRRKVPSGLFGWRFSKLFGT